jgi:polyisoprenoid-binding protein YceI
MFIRRITTLAPVALVSLLLAACASAATPSPTQSPSVSSVSTGGTSAPGDWVVSNTSKATAKVREQLVNVSLPSDAVLTATGASGSFTLKDDGTFSSDSKITFDLTTLSSDQSQRDQFVKMDTLATRQYPTAQLVPTTVSGLSLPLPTSGQFTFTLTGNLTIHGTTKTVTFDVTAKRDGGSLTATATANPSLRFEDFGMSPPSVPLRVLSVVDEIRLSVDLVANGPTT